MKYSRYNTVIDISAQACVVYNALSDCFVLLPYRLRKILTLDPAFLLEKYESLYRKLEEGRCIVWEETDELELCKAKIGQAQENKQAYMLTVHPTTECNFQCWYCYEKHTKPLRMPEEIVRRILLFIDRMAHTELRYFSLNFSGGEPLLCWQDVVLPMMSYFTEVCKRRNIHSEISFISNAYALDPHIIRDLKAFPVNSFQVTWEGCRKEQDNIRFTSSRPGSYDRILSNMQNLLENGVPVVLRVNYTTGNFRHLPEMIPDLERLQTVFGKLFRVDFHRIWEDCVLTREVEVSRKLRSVFRERGFAVVDRNKLFPSACPADQKNEAVVHANGHVYKCTFGRFTENNKMGTLNEEGVIEWDKELLNQWNHARFNRKACYECRIAPLCGGGCRRKSMETAGQEKCFMYRNEKQKDRMVYNRFVHRYFSS